MLYLPRILVSGEIYANIILVSFISRPYWRFYSLFFKHLAIGTQKSGQMVGYLCHTICSRSLVGGRLLRLLARWRGELRSTCWLLW